MSVEPLDLRRAWAQNLQNSLYNCGRLEDEQKQLDRAYLPHATLLSRGLCDAGASNPTLNRYSNLFPLDSSRVVLRTGNHDFINANTISLPQLPHDDKKEWIIAQGPMHPDWHGPDTLPDFWRCIFEQDVNIVISLSTSSPGYEGVARWWPTGGKGGKATFEEFCVRVEQEQSTPKGNLLREMVLSVGSSQRKILHLQSLSWPNYGVPEDTGGILEMLSLCRSARRTSLGPTLVHCSGGVGRSGTFVATYTALASSLWSWSEADDGKISDANSSAFSILPIVEALRRQRHSDCVEGKAQLSFAYECVMDAVLTSPKSTV